MKYKLTINDSLELTSDETTQLQIKHQVDENTKIELIGRDDLLEIMKWLNKHIERVSDKK